MQVAVGVVLDEHQQVLIAERKLDQHQGGLWEFPGGKLESGEAVFDALKRELLEEVGLTIHDSQDWMTLRHDYPDKSVELFVHRVTAFDGEAHGHEGQQVRWVSLAELNHYTFPMANQPILEALCCDG